MAGYRAARSAHARRDRLRRRQPGRLDAPLPRARAPGERHDGAGAGRMIDPGLQRYALLALASALLFGAAAPAVKPIAAAMSPVLLAGLLYLGSFLGLACARSFRRTDEARL